MNDNDYAPLYQHEDELISVRIGKANTSDGAFLAVDGNVQFGFTEGQYDDMLLPLLRAIHNESIEGVFKFYKCQNGDYRLQSQVLLLVMNNQTGLALQHQTKKILGALNNHLQQIAV